jgi:hypothetical protein
VKHRLIIVLALVGAALGLPGRVTAQEGGNGGGTPGTSSNFELVGHEPLFGRGMNAALALYGSTAYVGNRTDGSSRCGMGDPRRDTTGLDSCPHPHPGILVVDASDPANPAVVNEIGPPYAGMVNETTRELRVWPERKLLMVLSFGCSAVIHACPGVDHEAAVPAFRFFDLSDPLHPAFLSEWTPRQADGTIRVPHEFFLWADPQNPARTLLWMSTPTTSVDPNRANMMIVDISAVPDGAQPTLIAQGNWNPQYPGAENPANYDNNLALHSMWPTFAGNRTHLAYLSGHFLVLDTKKVARNMLPAGVVEDLNDNLLTRPEDRPTWPNPNPGHSAVPFPGRPYIFMIDEVYGTFTDPRFGCPWGWARSIQVSQPRHPHQLGEYKLPENSCPAPTQADQERSSYGAHNPTLTRNVALDSWHSGGLQAIDIKNPRKMRQLGWFSPTPLDTVANEDPALSGGTNKVVMWSFPIIKDGLIYVVDIRNGLYILRYTGPRAEEVSEVTFLEGNSNLGDAARLAAEATSLDLAQIEG